MALVSRRALALLLPCLAAFPAAAASADPPEEADAPAERLHASSGRNWTPQSQKYATVTLPLIALFDLTKGAILSVKWSPLPQDAVPITAYADPWGNGSIVLVMESATFTPIEPGDYVPEAGDPIEFKTLAGKHPAK